MIEKEDNQDLILDFTFLEELNKSDVTDDQLITKYELKAGSEPIPSENSVIYFKMELRYHSGELIPKQQIKNVRKIRIFKSDYFIGLNYAIKSMKDKEVSWFKIDHEYH